MLYLRKLAVVLLVTLSFHAQAHADDWSKGVALYEKGEYSAALVQFQDIISQRPDAGGAWYYIGLCEFKLQRYKKVELPLSHAIDLLEIQSPDSPEIAGAWYTIGFSYFQLGDYEKSIEPLKKYIALNSKSRREVDPTARTAIGRAYFFLDRHDEAIQFLSAGPAADKSKERAANNYYLGAIHYRKGDDDKAIPFLREAVKTNGEDAATLELLAESLLRKAGKTNSQPIFAEAAEVGEKMAGKADENRVANILGRAYLGARLFDKAVEPLEKLARANPDNGQAWLYYGVALSRSGQLRKAMEVLEMTIQIAPDSTAAVSELAFVYESDRQYQQAIRVYEKAYARTNDPAIKANIERLRALSSQQP